MGTTLHAAQKLERNWIGIDITHLAINLVKNRLFDAFGIMPDIVGEPKDIEGARQLAMQDSLQFQWWVLSLIGARPFADGKKKGEDCGIDGIIYNPVKGSEKVYKGIVQVKSGHVDVKHIRDLVGTMEKVKADYCIFITLEEPTGPMNKEASKVGYFKDVFNQDIPRIQMFRIEELLNGRKPIYPVPPDNFKKAEKEKDAKSSGKDADLLDFFANLENYEKSPDHSKETLKWIMR
jgi:site-specific DNA-methyltransferase (adenine-specific)